MSCKATRLFSPVHIPRCKITLRGIRPAPWRTPSALPKGYDDALAFTRLKLPQAPWALYVRLRKLAGPSARPAVPRVGALPSSGPKLRAGPSQIRSPQTPPPPPNTAQPHKTLSTRRPQKNTMSIRVGINGFGRIGRLVMRAAQTNPNISIVPSVWKSNCGRPTPSTRRCLCSCVCSMAWRIYASDATG